MTVRIFESGLVNVGVDRAWALVRDFVAPPRYAPEITSCTMENDAPADRVGAVRIMVFDGKVTARERLESLSDTERVVEYALLPPEELPVRNYLGRLQVIPVTESGKALITWSARFEPEGMAPDDAVAWLSKTYRSGIGGMRELLDREKLA